LDRTGRPPTGYVTKRLAEDWLRAVLDQEWMGHADIQTTMRYLHYAPRAEDAATVARAFRVRSSAAPSADQADVDVGADAEVAPAAIGRQDG